MTNCLVFFIIKIHWNIEKINLVSIMLFEVASNSILNGNGDLVTMCKSLGQSVPMPSNLLSSLFSTTTSKA